LGKLHYSSLTVNRIPIKLGLPIDSLIAGLNYCGIATLSFLSLLQQPTVSIHETAYQAEVDLSSCTRWMLDRQTTWIEEDEEDEDEDGDDPDEDRPGAAPQSSLDMSCLQAALEYHETIAGFCGRCGKIADTCYCFWNVGALAVSIFEVTAAHLTDAITDPWEAPTC
jgi:geranylgeranyl transferase type-1 subunit beta